MKASVGDQLIVHQFEHETFEHETGAYGEVLKAYQALEEWVVDNGYVARGMPWECYLDGPEVTAPRTMIFLPVAEPKLASGQG